MAACATATSAMHHVPSVYVTSADGEIHALRQSDGAVLWMQRIAPQQAGDVLSLDALGIVNSTLIIHTFEEQRQTGSLADDSISGVDTTTGAIQWHDAGVTMIPAIQELCTPLPPVSGPGVCAEGDAILALHRTNGGTFLAAIDARTGNVHDSVNFASLAARFLSLGAGTLYSGSTIPLATPTPSAATVTAWNSSTGAMIWQHSLPGSMYSDPVANGDQVLVRTATQVMALRASDGAQVWTATEQPPNQLFGSASLVLEGTQHAKQTAAPGRGVPDGFLVTARDATTGAVRWQTTIGTQAQIIAVIRGIVLVDAFGQVVGIDLASGKTVWKTDESVSNIADAVRYEMAAQTASRFVVMDAPSLLVLDTSTGQAQRWTIVGLGLGEQVVANDTQIFAYDLTDGTVIAVDAQHGAQQWRQQFTLDTPSSLIARRVIADP